MANREHLEPLFQKHDLIDFKSVVYGLLHHLQRLPRIERRV